MKQPITTKKIIYCRPHNGFNDMLVHMNENYKYALKYDRHLFINTDLSGFLDNFAHYFESLSPNVTFGSQEDFKHFLSGHCTEVKHMNVYPPDLQNRLFDYQTFRDFNSFKIQNLND